MSKRIKKVISLVLIFMIAMFQTLSTFAASGGGSKFEIVDSEYGIYRLNSSRERLATKVHVEGKCIKVCVEVIPMQN